MSQGPPPTPKLSKFLRPEWRDRPRSSSGDGGVTSSNESPARMSRIVGKKGSKLFGKTKDEDGDSGLVANKSLSSSNAGIGDPPVIIEPPSNSTPRARPPRPSNVSDNPKGHNSNIVASSTSAPSGNGGSIRNMGDFPSRLSGWFSAISGSSTDLSLPNILSSSSLSTSQVLAGSPKTKPTHPLITAAKHGKDHLDKAMRYLLDSDAQPDKSTDKIWLLGVEHPGYEPPPPPSSMPPTALVPTSPTSTLSPPGKRNHRRDSADSRTKSPSSFRSPIPTTHSNSSTHSLSSAISFSSTINPNAPSSRTGIAWPAAFYSDYTSRVWLTYRNTFPPIRDSSLASLEPIPSSSTQGSLSSTDISAPLPSPLKSKWPWGAEKGWTSDAGWGCMLRTGQSLLANALIHLHLSRSWRKPTQSSFTPEYVQYVRILTWFLDTPSPQSPFGVHRMALAGKELGKEVGSWFGPSTAAGAIKRLVGEFEDAGLEVVVAVDSVVYESDVYAASCTPRGPHTAAANGFKASGIGASKHHGKKIQYARKWGDRAVLVLVGIRLGIDGVNPIYYDSVKALFTFPQSVGIAGGRPSSSYYFVGSQGDSLFYLDPHHTRPAVPLRPPPSLSTFDEISMASTDDGLSQASSRLGKRRGSDFKQGHTSTPDTSESDRRPSKRLSIRRASINRVSSYQQQAAAPTSPSSVHSGSSLSHPSSAVSVTGGSHAHSQSHSSHSGHSTTPLSSSPLARTSMPPSSHRPTGSSPTRVGSSSALPLSPSSSGFAQSPSTASSGGMNIPVSPAGSVSTLDPMSVFMATAYPLSELRTFHCERVRKMPLSGLDPSMLLGFLCRDEQDWKNLRERVTDMAKTKKAIFSIQDEPPVWPDDDEDDLDLESASSDQDADEVESPVGAEGEDELDDNELEIKPRSGKSEPAKVDTKNDSDDDDEDDDGDDGLNVVTPIQPSTKFTTSRHDTIIGRARPEMAAAAAAASKTSTSQHHDPKDNRENDVDDDDDDDDWVDPIKPSSPVTAPTEAAVISEHNKTSSSNGPVSSESSDAGSRRGRGDEASVTPRPTSAVQPITSPSLQQPRQRPAPKDLPAIPTTIVSMSRQPSSRPSSASRRLSQVAISDAPVPFPTRASDHRKHSSASSRSATPSSDPVSPVSSSASQHPGHSTSNSTSTSNSHPYIHHRQPPSIAERDATGYPFPGSTTDESEGTSSDSGPSSDAWGGDEKLGTRGSLVPKRERRTTVGRTAAHSPAVVPTPIPTVPLAPSGNGNSQPQNTERLSSIGKAKHGGRTTGGAIRAVWNDEDGDDF